MTIQLEDLKQPSRELFLNCLKTKEHPFNIRARAINAYRKMARQSVNGGGHVQIKKHIETDKKEDSSKKKKRISEREVRKFGTQGKKNSKTFSALKAVVRWTSGGKDRPSRKRKIQFATKNLTIHLKGNKWSGGQREF